MSTAKLLFHGRIITFLLCLAVPLAPARADQLQVAVASNFRNAMTAAAAQFEVASGHQVTLITGSTGKHYAQIVNGAPYDALFAADAERPRRLEAEQRGIPGTRFTYAIGKLVLWSATAGLVDDRGQVLQSGGFAHLAIANPSLAPYGAAARQVLEQLGLWEKLASKLVRGENIGQAFQFVVTGNAELGFVALAQLASPLGSNGGSSWIPPQELYDPIEQQAILLRDSPAARELMAFMRGAQAGALFRTYGYDVPDVQ